MRQEPAKGPAPRRKQNTSFLAEFFNFDRIKFKMFRLEGIDWNLVITLIFLLAFGLLMVYSASSYVAQRDYSDPTKFFDSQLKNDIIGLVLMVVVAFFPYRLWEKFRHVEYIMAALLILLVLSFGVESHGAIRWVKIFGIQFQPAEASKLLLILYLAALADRFGKSIDNAAFFLFYLCVTLPVCLEIFVVTDNLSSALIIFGIGFVMLFIATRGVKVFMGMVVVGALGVAGLVSYVANKMDINSDTNFRFGRIASWLHPETSTESTAHQTLQALYAIGSGGIWGKGLGKGVQKLGNLPEPHNDMIFAVICEELGIVGAVVIILLYIMLLWRMYTIARNTKDRYGFMIVVGVMAHIAIQTVLNIAVATNTIPNTGVSLPFISFGGSSAIFTLAEIGLVMSVHRYNVIEADAG